MDWLSEAGYDVVLKPVRIVLIVLLAIILRALIHRMLRRIAARAGEERRSLLHPLRGRMPAVLQDTLRSERRRQRAEALGSVLRSTVSATILAITIMLVLGELGVNLVPILASAGIIGVAVGLGSQHVVRDLVAGLFMLLEDQYGVGDVIDVGDVTGTVEEIGLRITTLRDQDGVLWFIRNGEITRVGNRSQARAARGAVPARPDESAS